MTNNPTRDQTIRLGAIAPMTKPGWTGAGRQLLAGLDVGFSEIDEEGICGRKLELLVEDTAADAQKAVAAVDRLAEQGVAAIVGEYHSVVARAVAMRADELRLPFLCTSAVLDMLTDAPTDWVARLSPPQSRGWRVYGDFLVAHGHLKVAVARESSIYWDAGIRILREQLHAAGGEIAEFDMCGLTHDDLCEGLTAGRATALVLLVGAPEPFASIVSKVRRDHRLDEMLIGAPAGQPELAEVHSVLGAQGAGVPFLQYLPDRMSQAGISVTKRLKEKLGETPSFVALEGYDAAKIIGELCTLRLRGLAITDVWQGIDIEGSRGRVNFCRTANSGVWQWNGAPVQVADRDPADPTRIRVHEIL